MIKVYYQGCTGQIIDFASENYKMHKDTNLLSYKWEYSNSEYANRIESFSMNFVDKSFTVSVFGRTREEYQAAVNRLNEVFERDIKKLSPGKLYVGNNYLRCYMIESDCSRFDVHKNKVTKTYTLVAENGQWIKETEYLASRDMMVLTEGTDRAIEIDYPHDYPHDYYMASGVMSAVNTNIEDADFIMRIFGSCINPVVYINDYAYRVNVELYEGEYLEIDSVRKKIIKYNAKGEQTNCFNLRSRETYIFKKLSPGKIAIAKNSPFLLSLTVLEYRSEPEWWI